MKITDDHWLDSAIRQPIPGGSEMKVRRFIVEHHTAGASALSSINFWKTKDAKGASAHLVIDRDGTIYQCRPFNRTCGHAGVSKWKDPNTGKLYVGLNACSIGIEIANGGDSYPRKFSALEPFVGKHKNGGQVKEWESYPKVQIEAVKAVSKAITERYHIDDLIGHEDIAPDRKNDPGPAFPMQEVREYCGFKNPIKKL